MTGEMPQHWAKWLSLVEWWYNTSFHSAAQTTPFEVLYGYAPPIHLPYFSGDSKVAAVDQFLTDNETTLKLLKFHLSRAQNRMRQLVNKHRTDKSFSIGDFVYLKLQPYRQIIV